MTPEEIRAGVDEVREWVDEYPEATVLALWEARAWVEMGYDSWDALVAGEWSRSIVLPRPERREVVGRLRQEGMSTRAIAAAVGVSHPTIQSDLKSTGKDLPDEITSLDGRTRPATQPARVIEPEVLTSQQWMAREGYDRPDELAPRRRTEAEREALRAKSKADAIRQRNLDLNVGFSTISELAHPHILAEVLDNWQPLSTDWTPAMLHDLADLLHSIADQWKATA